MNIYIIIHSRCFMIQTPRMTRTASSITFQSNIMRPGNYLQFVRAKNHEAKKKNGKNILIENK